MNHLYEKNYPKDSFRVFVLSCFRDENNLPKSGYRVSRSKAHMYKQDYTIRSYEIDAAGHLSVPSIFNLLQDAASGHALELGVSVPQLLADNYTWVLSRMVLNMSHYPGWRDAIQIHTWPS